MSFIKIFFLSLVFYLLYKAIRFFSQLNKVINSQKVNNKNTGKDKKYSKDEIQDAEYEEIK